MVRVQERGDDAGCVSQSELQAGSECTLAESGKVCWQPGGRKSDSNIDTTGDEEAAKVVYARGGVRDQQAISQYGNAGEGYGEDCSLLPSITEPSNDEICDCTQSIAWDGQRLHLGASPVSEGFDDGWQEGTVPV